MNYEALLFDCDGVLVDSEAITNGVLCAMLNEAGWALAPDECMRIFIGKTVRSEAGIEAQVKPVLKLAEQFFLSPPSILEGHQGLDALLDEAYLAHRLVEEVNDRYITHLGQPLIPLDTTVANVIAHQLIGEPFANQLDEAVHHAVDELLDEQVFQQDSVQEYRTRLSNPQTVAAWQNWPCLSRQLGVELGLPVSA